VYFGPVLALYLGVYGLLLGTTRGIPYVTDGNESYSMLVHASNLYHFPLSRTFGLSDEAYSREPSAHPYAYTHQGNFPRLFSFVLYVVGARSVESQIVITTFTIGLLAVFLMFEYFSTVTSAAFAVVATTVAMTDYLLFGQWQVNTYRVWHGLFFFLALICVHRLEGRRRGVWLGITFLTFASLFYFELVFGAYIAIMTGLYAGVRYWRRPALLAQCWLVQFAGAVAAVITLAGQLVGYLGWTDFVQDLRLTYTARNVGGANQAYMDAIREFVDSRHIVFWYNFARAYQRSAFEVLSSITRGYFSTYTPTLWYLVAILIAGWCAGLCFRESRTSSTVSAGPHWASRSMVPAAVPSVLLLVAWSRFLMALLQPQALNGVGGPRVSAAGDMAPLALIITAAFGIALVLATSRLVTGDWLRVLPPTRTVIAAGLLLFAEHVVVDARDLFEQSYLPLWSHIQGAGFAGWVVQLLIIFAAALATIMVLIPSAIRDTQWPALASYFICGLFAYVVVYLLSPGYVATGYLDRTVPFASFLFETAIGLVIFILWSVPRRLLTDTRDLRHRAENRTQGPPAARIAFSREPRSLATAGSLIVLLLITGYWVRVQAVHVSLIPPTDFMFVQQLGKPPFQGASFAVNTYAAPIYAYTGEWAYYDFRLGDKDGGAVTATDHGYRVIRDVDTYLWLADRADRTKYQRPQYFLCYEHQDLHTAVSRLHGGSPGCSLAGPVKYASDPTQFSVAREVVARDQSGRNSWAIVKLDWAVLDRQPHSSGIGTQP